MCRAKNEKKCTQVSDTDLKKGGRLDDQGLDGEKY